MILQRVLFPSENRPKELYMRDKGEWVSFDTFFNSFSIEKWEKYTNLKNLLIKVNLKNYDETFNIKVYNKKLVKNKIEIIEIKTIRKEHNVYEICNLGEIKKGIIYFEIEQKYLNKISKIDYISENVHNINQNKVNLALIICTYKREAYVQKFLDSFSRIIKKNFIKNRMKVYIVDNAKTLSLLQTPENVKIFKNKNYGGAGGFTRGIIEAVRDKATHILLMDDDIEIEESILERLLSFLIILKKEYREYFIGGSMLIKEKPKIQCEKVGIWKKYRNVSIGKNKNLTNEKEVLINEKEEKIKLKYAAWWFCCFSVDNVKKRGLPSPFFIKGDDVEYSLRNNSNIINLNGLSVWHEDFSGKYSPYLYYYTVRNNIMTNFLTDKINYSKLDFWENIILRCGNNILKMRKIETFMMKKALQDIKKGLEVFDEIEPDKYHQELIILSKQQHNFLKNQIEILKLSIYISKNFNNIRKNFKQKKQYYHSFEFWENYLDMGGNKHDTAL